MFLTEEKAKNRLKALKVAASNAVMATPSGVQALRGFYTRQFFGGLELLKNHF